MLNHLVVSAILAVATASPAFRSGSSQFRGGPGVGRQITNASSDSSWDYIIAGAGPAGIIAATRLAEANKKVLLLEYGGPSTFSSGGNFSTTFNANSVTEQNLTIYDVPGQSSPLFSTSAGKYCPDVPGSAGCLLGGGVSVNALMFIHPPSHDFDDKWPTGWKWSDVESAANSLYEVNPGSSTPSADGIIYDASEFDIMSSFLGAQGFSEVDSIAEPDKKSLAYAHPPFNVKSGERAGPVRTYLPIAQTKDNFSLQLYSKVVRVLRTGSKVTGVEIENTQTNIRSTISICSTGRVVLAAGAMSSPRILINSGIGPAAMINIVANGTSNITLPDQKDWISLPVGTVIKDHPIVSVNFNTTSELIIYPFASALAADQELYYTSRTGVLAQGYQRLVFWDTFTGSDGVVRYIQGTTAASKNNTIQVKFYLTHGATSSGELGIDATGSTYFVTKPWFTTDEDKNGLAAYIDDFIAKAANGTAMVASTSATGAELIVSSQSPGTHYVGTAVMGTDDGRQGGKSVVDLNTKVYGTDNLFVVDASVHPDLPTGNTMAIVMVVAEAAVKKILAC